MTGASRPAAVIAAVVAAVLAAAGPALADGKPPTEKDRQAASELVKKAIARSQAGDHGAAIKIYLQAYTLVPNSLLLSNIGAEFQQDGMYKEALDYFCKYLEQDPAGTNAPYARSQAKILQRQLGRKRVDDRDVCAAPKAEEPATEPARPTSDRGFGDRDKRDARDDKGDARDDKPVRDKPARGERTAQRGGDDPTTDAPEVASRGNPTLMYTGLATGVAGLVATGVGIYAGVQGKQISDQINSHDPMTPWPDNIKDLERRGEAYNRLQVISLIGGGVLITTGIVLFVVSRPDAPERADKSVVHVVPTSNGLAVFGRF
jgi:tetratricopeptide (TPR) repeat protein